MPPSRGSTNLLIEIYGVTAVIRSKSPRLLGVLENLGNDFKPLSNPETTARPSVLVYLTKITPSARLGKGRPQFIFKTRMAKVFGWGVRRHCEYAGVYAELKMSKGRHIFWISGSDENLLREVAFKALLSSLGELLDLKGYHRIHALGVAIESKSSLLIANSGVGKSSIACLLKKNGRSFALYSDENPLLRGRQLYSYPLRLALGPQVVQALGLPLGPIYERQSLAPKMLLPFPLDQEALPAPVDYILIGRSTDQAPNIVSTSKLGALPQLFLSLVVGVGLAQMSEWMLRPLNLPRLVSIALKRSSSLLSTLWSAQGTFIFRMSKDANLNENYLYRWHQERPTEAKRRLNF